MTAPIRVAAQRAPCPRSPPSGRSSVLMAGPTSVPRVRFSRTPPRALGVRVGDSRIREPEGCAPNDPGFGRGSRRCPTAATRWVMQSRVDDGYGRPWPQKAKGQWLKAEGQDGERQNVGSQDAKALKPAGREEAGWMKGSGDGNWKLNTGNPEKGTGWKSRERESGTRDGDRPAPTNASGLRSSTASTKGWCNRERRMDECGGWKRWRKPTVETGYFEAEGERTRGAR